MSSKRSAPTRRSFLRTSGTLAGSLPFLATGNARAAMPQDTLRLALIGCGGRGTGAASQALSTSIARAGGVKLHAMADAFQDRLEGSLEGLMKNHADKIEVPRDRKFVGFDAFQKAIDSGVDMVILTTPPGFRPVHFSYAVEQGKHVFMEKPVATDAPGIRRVLEAAKQAKEKNLKVGVGLQRHHSPRYEETVRRLQAGELGDIQLLRAYWNSGGVWVRGRKPEQSEMDYQMRNWYYFNWLCGDHIVEQHIHNIDVCNWIKGGPPVKAQGVGGRQVRTGIDHGEIFDHHMLEFTYADGSVMMSECRHIKNTWSDVAEYAHGSLGQAAISRGRFEFKDGKSWKYDGPSADAYQVEHDRLQAAIAQDSEHNEAEYGASSTMTAILGRMATYSGQSIRYEDALNKGRLVHPEGLTWADDPPTVPDSAGRYPIPMPGSTQVLED